MQLNNKISIQTKTYFITDGEFIKIGKTDDVSKRISGFASGNPKPLILLAVIDNNVETKLHVKFMKNRLHNEWFILTVPLLELIISNAVKTPDASRMISRFKMSLKGAFKENKKKTIKNSNRITSFFTGVYRNKKLYAIRIDSVTRGKVISKFRDLQNSSVDKLLLLAEAEGALERRFYREFIKYRLNNTEFFKPVAPILELIKNFKKLNILVKRIESQYLVGHNP